MFSCCYGYAEGIHEVSTSSNTDEDARRRLRLGLLLEEKVDGEVRVDAGCSVTAALTEERKPELPGAVADHVPATAPAQAIESLACCRLLPDHTCIGGDRSASSFDKEQAAKLLAVAKDDAWAPITSRFGSRSTQRFALFREGSALKLIKGVTTMVGTAQEMFVYLSQPEAFDEQMRVADTLYIGGRVLSQGPHCIVAHAKFRTPPGISNRDFCFYNYFSMPDEHTAVSVAWSIQDPACPSSDDFVRGEILVSGYIARDLPNGEGCELTYVVQVDLKGWLPAWVLNLVAADQADNVTRIADFFKRQAKTDGRPSV